MILTGGEERGTAQLITFRVPRSDSPDFVHPPPPPETLQVFLPPHTRCRTVFRVRFGGVGSSLSGSLSISSSTSSMAAQAAMPDRSLLESCGTAV